MSRQYSLQKLRLKRYPPLPPRYFHSSPHQNIAVTFSLADTPTEKPLTSLFQSKTSDVQRAYAILESRKREELSDSISRESPNPSRVWHNYIDLLGFVKASQLPLEVHQAVLRKCVPSCAELRVANARRLQAGNVPSNPHVHEMRLQTVIRNIRIAGYMPALEDYHFILEQFAAVGHHLGVKSVYQEIIRRGLVPRSRTYGLCLQAIGHRLALPCKTSQRESLVSEASSLCTEFLNKMWESNIPFVSVNLDLATRILQETCDYNSFVSLLKLAYGVDLDYPDRPPLALMAPSAKAGAPSSGALEHIREPLPFSTDALNTTIDFLGRNGHISKMVQAFEVLTQPLPMQASEHFSSSFDDEDDYGISSEPVSPPYHLPHTTPNTTTYNLLIRHISASGNAALARHYVLLMMHNDFLTDRALRVDILRKPIGEVVAPRLSTNRGGLLAVYGEAHRQKDIEMLRFILRVIERTLRRKKVHLAHYSGYQRKLRLDEKIQASLNFNQERYADVPSSNSLSAEPDKEDSQSHPQKSNSAPPISPCTTTFFTSSKGEKSSPIASVLDIDLDSASRPVRGVKHFDLNLHLRLLRRDIKEIGELRERVIDVLGRSVQRIKEKLGRRVWKGKDVYLADHGKRVVISRQSWAEAVRFKPAAQGSNFSKASNIARPRKEIAQHPYMARP